MILSPLALDGAWLITIERLEDARGFFARSFCAAEFARHGLPTQFMQSSISFNRRRATLRGMHYQAPPCAEGKLVRCTRGAIFDVLLDLRLASATYCRWLALELTQDDANAVYIPPGFAHGFQTLCDDTEILYQMTEAYSPGHARGVRWNDPAFAIDWKLAEPILAPRDATYPDFTP